MSMRGEIISKEFKRMKIVHDNNRKEYVCYAETVKDFQEGETINAHQQRQCLDTSLVLGDTW